MRAKPRRRRWAAPALAGAALLVAAALLAGWALQARGSAASPDPAGRGAPPASGRMAADDGFPDVDWDRWLAVNPDVVGWVSVPGTDISQPIVAAPADDRDWYLAHDVEGAWNPWGAVYLDADCVADGLFGGRDATVMGHNMLDGTMLGQLESYNDQAWAEDHPVVLLQTPKEKRAMIVACAGAIDGSSAQRRSSFESDEDFADYLGDRLTGASAVVAGIPRGTSRVTTLVTCSSQFNPDNERTLVTLVERN